MDFPELTPEERAKAWAKATAIRQARGDLLAAIQAGKLPIAAVLARAETDTIVSKTRVSVVVKALPGVDAVRAAHILGGLSIAEAQRIGGLGPHQRRTLLDLVAGSSPEDTTQKERPAAPAAAALDPSTIAAAIPEFLEGLSPAHSMNPREDESALLEGLWANEQDNREVHVVIRERATTPEQMELIRAGRVYTGDYPQYKIVDTSRLRAVNAVGAMLVDSDPTGILDEPSSIRDIVIRMPHLQVEVVSWKAAVTTEIGTRVAELIAAGT
ncbi:MULTISPECIES: integration host factor, actinobacterial type [Rhodococcus]|uniref:integration host factor, actinobacterial type n=1 Tax=Rhodococcus TaxID=1827 RepID=UPI0007C6B1CD|nr:integration host factor, actinobacterial type [Rhodococcus sp. WAY2]QHE73645.1 integration host factor [Rhodococcus sp. WAY2]